MSLSDIPTLSSAQDAPHVDVPADILKPQMSDRVVITTTQDPASPTSEENRKPFPQFNPFRKFVIKELQHRKTQYPTMPVTPFARMSSCNIDKINKYVFFSLGLHGFNSEASNIFDLTYNDNQHDVVGTAINIGSKKRRVVSTNELSAQPDADMQDFEATYKSQLSKANRPIPGITSIVSKRRGLGEPMTVDIQWTCYNRGQLEFLRQHFLIPGTYIVVEFGHNFADRPVEQMLDFGKGEDLFTELVEIIGLPQKTGVSSQYGRSRIIKNYNQTNNGNYDVVVGQIANFEIKLEPESGIYKCTTHLVSQGENIWGIKIDQTYVSRNEDTPLEISTISDYFEQKMYHVLLTTHLNNRSAGLYKEAGTSFSKKDAEIATANNESTNIDDYMWMSWDFLFNEFITDMLSVIKDASITKQLREFMKLGKMGKDDWVGYHKNLISVEAETMLLLNSNSDAFNNDTLNNANKSTDDIVAALESYGSVGRFGDNPGDNSKDRPIGGAKLGTGLWLNTRMIHQCFASAYDLKQAFTTLLLSMNRAVCGYWQLQLFSDEENASYKIIDAKYGDQNETKKIDFYKFNVGPDESQPGGECLAVEFDAAFPPELITQMMLVARFRAMTVKDQDAYKMQYPLLGSTSAHMFILNWTNLEDGIQTRIKESSKDVSSDSTTDHNTFGDNSSISRKVDDDQDGASGAGTASGRGLNVGMGNKIPMAPIDNTKVTIPTLPPSSAYKLDSPPVAGEIPVSSRIGPRDVPGASHNHAGIDIKVPSGTPVLATNAGKVIRAGVVSGYGNAVYIKHDDGLTSVYGHLRQIHVHVNDRVSSGQDIGVSGGAESDPGHGSSTGAHLHYELLYPNNTVYKDTLSSLDKIAVVKVLPSSQDKWLAPFIPTARNGIPNTANPITGITAGKSISTNDATAQALQLRREEVTTKFGAHVWALTGNNQSAMRNRIAADGYKTENANIPNSFVAPYPTTTSVTVEIMGIAGISVSDGFFVDRIPATFEKHGVFQVTDVSDEITPKGWRTKVHGYFKMLWYSADGSRSIS